MNRETPSDWYQQGVTFAHKVQKGLREGKTFDEMKAFTPEQAAHVRDLHKRQGNVDFYIWFKGYLSQWD